MAHTHEVLDDDICFSIDPETRLITTESPLSLIQGDHNSERYTFEIPRLVDGHDMTLCNRVEIHFINIGSQGRNSDVYVVKDLKVDPEDKDYLIFSWLVSRAATSFAGSLNFVVAFKCLTGEVLDYAWHTAVFTSIKVLDSISAAETIVENYIDILESWRSDLTTFESRLEEIEARDVNPDIMSNALVGSAIGEVIRIDNVSPNEHTVRANVSCRNLLPYPYFETTKTENGITFTDNGDGTITVNGTATADASFRLRRNDETSFTLRAGTYTLSGCPSGGSWGTYRIHIQGKPGTTMASDFGSGGISRTFEEESPFSVYITISEGTVVDNLTFKPMLEAGSYANHYRSYAPYVDITSIHLSRYGKNLWGYRPSTVTNGVTITTDDNGVITYNGSCTKDFVISEVITLGVGTYTLSDNAIGSRPSTVDARTQVYIPSLGIDARIKHGDASDKFVTFTVTEPSTDVYLRIKAAGGFTYDGYSVSPLLEVGSDATDFEPYREPETYAPAADGTVSGVTSLAPTMTLTTADTTGVLIDVKYNKDINVFNEPIEQLLQNPGIEYLREDIDFNFYDIQDLWTALENSTVEIVQELGESTTAVMSQKAVYDMWDGMCNDDMVLYERTANLDERTANLDERIADLENSSSGSSDGSGGGWQEGYVAGAQEFIVDVYPAFSADEEGFTQPNIIARNVYIPLMGREWVPFYIVMMNKSTFETVGGAYVEMYDYGGGLAGYVYGYRFGVEVECSGDVECVVLYSR